MYGGRIAIFAGVRPVAVLRSRDDETGIGRTHPLNPATIRIEDGDIGATAVADLTALPDDSLRLTSLPKRESVCGGRASVPVIAHLPIDEARRSLIAAGWTPIRRSQHSEPRERALSARGIPEVRTCLGTALGSCEFGYRSAAGELTVTTIGDSDLPIVWDHGVRCR